MLFIFYCLIGCGIGHLLAVLVINIFNGIRYNEETKRELKQLKEERKAIDQIIEIDNLIISILKMNGDKENDT